MKLMYGLEFEFFVRNEKDEVMPAYKYTDHFDGSRVIGELRTDVFNSLVDAVFDLKRLIYLERLLLEKQNMSLSLTPEVRVTNDFIHAVRADDSFYKESLPVKLLSIYGSTTGKILPPTVFKASLQINISGNQSITSYNNRGDLNLKTIDTVFDYVSIIRKLDIYFDQEIRDTQRTKGVYAIKSGQFGNRVEYRSLPNDILLSKLLKFE